jgi:hypothetical protein
MTISNTFLRFLSTPMRGKPRIDLKFTSGQLEIIGDENLRQFRERGVDDMRDD